jgi:hypothetical protein
MNEDQTRIAGLIRRFLEGRVAPYEWDDFISIRLRDPALEEIRITCANIPKAFPAADRKHYCNQAGLAKLESLARSLEEATRGPN